MNAAVDDIKSLIEEQGKTWNAGFQEMRRDVDQLMARKNRSGLFGGGDNEQLGNEGVDKLAGAIKALYSGDERKANEFFASLDSKGMSAGSNPDGGFFIIPEFTTNITKIAAEISPVSELARTVTLTQGLAYEEPLDKDNSAPANWVSELVPTPRNETATPTVGMFRVELNELQAMPKATQLLIDQSGRDIIGWLQGKVGDAFGLAESAAFHTGTGVGKPRGFLTYPLDTADDATRQWGSIQVVNTGASGAFATPTATVNQADCLQQLIGKLKVQYRAGARFLMSRETAALVSQLKDATTGRWLWVDSLVQGQPSTLLSYPVDLSEDMNQVGAGSLSIAFWNPPKAYTIVRRPGIRFLPDPYTQKPNVLLYAFERVGGGVHNSEAIKLLRFS